MAAAGRGFDSLCGRFGRFAKDLNVLLRLCVTSGPLRVDFEAEYTTSMGWREWQLLAVQGALDVLRIGGCDVERSIWNEHHATDALAGPIAADVQQNPAILVDCQKRGVFANGYVQGECGAGGVFGRKGRRCCGPRAGSAKGTRC